MKKVILIGAIIAKGPNRGAYSVNGGLPVNSKKDLEHFKNKTKKHTVVMGYLTCKSMNFKPLSERENIVISNDPTLVLPGFVIVPSLTEAIRCARNGLVFVIGGEVLWKEALPTADEVMLTAINCKISRDSEIKVSYALLSVYSNDGFPYLYRHSSRIEEENTSDGHIKLEFIHYYKN